MDQAEGWLAASRAGGAGAWLFATFLVLQLVFYRSGLGWRFWVTIAVGAVGLILMPHEPRFGRGGPPAEQEGPAENAV